MTYRSYSNQSVFSLALASRGLVPTRIVHDVETFKPRTKLLETAKAWFVAVTAAVFTVIGLGQSLPTG
jgi:hypothetical protein